MLDVRVELPRRNLTRLLQALDGKAVRFAEIQALNRTGANMASAAREAVSEKMGIPEARLAKRGRRFDFRGQRQHGGVNPKRKASRSRPLVVISARGRPFNVKRFDGRPIYAGASSSIKTRKQRRRRKGARIVGVQHNAWGRPQVAAGVWQLKNGAFVIRDGGTFRGVFGPGVTHVFEYPDVLAELEKLAGRQFDQHFATAIEYAFGSQFHGRR